MMEEETRGKERRHAVVDCGEKRAAIVLDWGDGKDLVGWES
jgi:hypothetical protein